VWDIKARRTAIVAAAVAQLTFSNAAAEAKPIHLAPFTPWNVDYGNKICTLRRGFGSKEEPSLLIMDRFGPTDSFQFSIVSDEFSAFEQGRALTLRFGEQKPRRIASVVPGKSSNGTATLFFGNTSLSEAIGKKDEEWAPPVTAATEAAVKSIGISYGGRERIFATNRLDTAFEALRKCTDNLVTTWGLDPKQQAALSKRPEPLSKPAAWINSADYPPAMLDRGKQGLVNFRLSVSAQGTPTACEVQSSYNDKKFDEVTCAALMRRARFTPALDASGKAVPSFYLNTVRWLMS
jgi:TonB family protein